MLLAYPKRAEMDLRGWRERGFSMVYEINCRRADCVKRMDSLIGKKKKRQKKKQRSQKNQVIETIMLGWQSMYIDRQCRCLPLRIKLERGIQ